MDDVHLVLGSCPVAIATAHALLRRRLNVRMVNKSGHTTLRPPGVQVLAADLMDDDSMDKVSKGVGTVYFCAIPFRNQPLEMLHTLQRKAVRLADKVRANLVVGQSLDGYAGGDDPITETSSPRPITAREELLVSLHQDLLKETGALGVQYAVGRCSDMFGPDVSASALGIHVFKAIFAEKRLLSEGNLSAVHCFTFAPDFGKSLAVLGTDRLVENEVFNVPNPSGTSVTGFLELAAELASKPLKLRRAAGWMKKIHRLFDDDAVEILDGSPRFAAPYIVSHDKFMQRYGNLSTPLDLAIGATLRSVSMLHNYSHT